MIPLSGPITSAMVRAELGLSGPVASLLESGPFRRAAGITTGTVKASDLRGAHVARGRAVAVSNTQTLFGLMGNPAVASSRYRFVLEPGAALVSSYPTSNAMAIGQFPAGSTIVFDCYGDVDGAGGRYQIQGSQGGCALYAQYFNQTMVVNLKAGGRFRAGGGAGGVGGNGGPGGYGGSYQTVIGGAGGGGGAGGMWGKGEGGDGARTLGGAGSVGGAGQPGSNAGAFGQSGAGGAGGNGGRGGDGGAFGVDGQAGTAGQNGFAGQPGSDGGAPGSVGLGVAGTAGGSKGYYLFKGTATVTFNNAGAVFGLLG